MPDKNRERYYLQRLSQVLDLNWDGEPEEPDPPDFVINVENIRLGIEFTVYHHPPQPGNPPHQQQQSLKEQIVKRAEKIHHEAGGPALYTTVFFRDSVALRKFDIMPIAKKIANTVLNSATPTSPYEQQIEVPWSDLPHEVTHISMHGSIDGKDRLWHPDAGGWVQEADTEHTQSIIDQKNDKEKAAREFCDKLWLVIVNDIFSLAEQSEIGESGKSQRYDHSFDRLIWFEPHILRVSDLKRKPKGS